ncbi:KGK family protein [Stanieria cyanosphaera PCC 7437]|uniref:KGK family protein n=1 Tax=Stanieria cyanosphaera (strain ATCC 29371 / PCC 7437) TaxID=111780 RepID=K9XNX6_STAC7|nr:KGK domain-containing protein [Stanieria cyanosphaera]AFZ33746.1 KGK family protein [Stanieria cyanosphaera PCC 7437]
MTTDNNFSKTYRDINNNSVVISIGNHCVLKISKLLEVANQIFSNKTLQEVEEQLKQSGSGSLVLRNFGSYWNTQGVDAEILEPNFNSWKKGKIRMRVVLEFCPDEPEEAEKIDNHKIDNNSLDDIRSTISKQ